ncbi:hypothetical protein CHH49_18095 [Terribacillus saccharophilus]|uniref:hypothetical protein n=1 Tax=Terribacillus saccharophilus TaxID=361277 RepID=UPI000BA649D5|nr:hypothetical protein [Terribacillus saccharophilus]PAF20058.1 hypothetical protein CHH49_18095 [Terribacillus saccharophilus]
MINVQIAKMSPKEKRVLLVNDLIKFISSKGRRFFYSNRTRQTAYFTFTGINKTRLWYHDQNGSRINPYPSSRHREQSFSHGGTLYALMHDFSDYIMTGEYSNGKNGYGGLYGGAWGYSETDMKEIIEYAKKWGYLK